MGLLEDKARARLFYKYLSRIYDRVNPFVWTEAMRDEALDWFDVEAGDRVLDVGCGTGFATAGLLEHTDDVHGLDQSAHQLEQAYGKFGRTGPVRFYRGDAERLPFRDDSFAAVWSSGSIEYWPNPVETLAELRRVTEPGGPVLVVGPDYPNNTILQRVADAIMLFYDEAEADRMFREAGFREFDNYVQRARPGSPRAITTVARVPGGEDTGVDDAGGAADADDAAHVDDGDDADDEDGHGADDAADVDGTDVAVDGESPDAGP
jgi:demethylmenaquinone methyltransferase/2-methoxy-6-polyprenyl-1,4-benzoquinol methylase